MKKPPLIDAEARTNCVLATERWLARYESSWQSRPSMSFSVTMDQMTESMELLVDDMVNELTLAAGRLMLRMNDMETRP